MVRDDEGYLLTGNELLRNGRLPDGWLKDRAPLLLETSLLCVFAAGDVRHSAVRRVSSAIVEGALAITLVRQVLRDPIAVPRQHRDEVEHQAPDLP
jgi:thioredoxin reductase (NADPH)